ncbi:Short-chain dehydrogenase/reductase SDR [Penicillium griseofulvum]|uniref:Short-chain dehydrogenase/reductase SDR n=1 Tax=Penicillium patulum TaxID=5078 RepID=A0A135LMZ0_PENPA|nr:Short-chain dehydrogenase/reductase SDR [Penicillium griseofulvum]KXG50322.1 Short-chain dehydrogenase/reductase SDR [Penicillium griseofulvum]
MNFPQPKVASLPPNLDLHGKTAVITGATAGIGLETARQLLKLHVSHLIIAVRSVSKGEACKRELQRLNPHAKITVLELDMDNYQSVQRFAKALKLKVPSVNILLLNAGIGLLKLERSPSGHDRVTQVNYVSNALLIAELLPYLKASAEQIGQSTRITWVGSRMYFTTSFEKKAPMKIGEHMDSKQFFFPNERYNDSKLLCAMFMYSLAARLDKSKVILNMVCPGLINTNMTDVLPFHMRMVMGVVKALLARPVEIGGRLFVNASVAAGPESHGGFLGDMEIIEPSPYLLSPAGKAVQRKLWAETIEELGSLS